MSEAPRSPTSSCNANDGIRRGDALIPQQSIRNETLRRTLGMSVEPYGAPLSDAQGSWVSGRVSHFGGPEDFGVGPRDTVALSSEIARELNTPLNPSDRDLNERPEDFYYLAMRWDYSPEGASLWRNSRIVLKNPENGRQVIVRPVDWGPHTRTRRIVDISPQALADLGAATDDELFVAFAEEGTPLGPLRCE